MGKKKNIFIAGHRGMVGSAILRKLKESRDVNLILRPRNELDLLQQSEVETFFKEQPIDEVYLAAARVGGIYANQTYPAQFIHENLLIQSNIIHSSFSNGVKKLLFLGSSCIYPREADQPIKESALLSAPLETTNEPYAIAKIAGIKLCESYNRQYGKSHGIDYRSVMPTNLYGPGDNYHLENAHVLPALIRKMHEGKERKDSRMIVWGTGRPKREFLYADDLANACVHLMNIDAALFYQNRHPQCSHVNIGSGQELSISELAELVSQVVGFQGKIVFDTSKPDGTPQKRLDSSVVHQLGWKPKVGLEEGIRLAYEDFKKRH